MKIILLGNSSYGQVVAYDTNNNNRYENGEKTFLLKFTSENTNGNIKTIEEHDFTENKVQEALQELGIDPTSKNLSVRPYLFYSENANEPIAPPQIQCPDGYEFRDTINAGVQEYICFPMLRCERFEDFPELNNCH